MKMKKSLFATMALSVAVPAGYAATPSLAASVEQAFVGTPNTPAVHVDALDKAPKPSDLLDANSRTGVTAMNAVGNAKDQVNLDLGSTRLVASDGSLRFFVIKGNAPGQGNVICTYVRDMAQPLDVHGAIINVTPTATPALSGGCSPIATNPNQNDLVTSIGEAPWTANGANTWVTVGYAPDGYNSATLDGTPLQIQNNFWLIPRHSVGGTVVVTGQGKTPITVTMPSE